MTDLRTQLRPALSLLAAYTVLLGLLYPALVTGVSQLVFPSAANGSLVRRDGQPAGSALLGQAFADPSRFWSRPSATPAVPYDGAASSGSNLGPLSDALVEAVQGRIAALRAADPGNMLPIPVDLVTASGSGLDPHISPAAARYQVPRVARVRGMDPGRVQALVAQHTQGRFLGVFGGSGVNVLALNLALDAAAAQ